jgi:hypothetical protein
MTLGPRGYEREEIINTWWVPPSLRKVNYTVIYFFKALCTCHPEQQAGNAAPKVYESEAKFSYLFIIMGY